MAGNKGYLYTNGVIAAISGRLISKDTFYKMIDSNNLDNVISIFNNTSFISGKKVSLVYDIIKLVNLEKFNLHNFLKNECPDQVFIDFIDCYYDYYNLETIYKNILFNLKLEVNNLIIGKYGVEKIIDALLSNNYDDFNNLFIKELFEKVNLVKDKINSWSKIDFYFKSYYYKNLTDIVKKNKLFNGLLKYKIDFQNLQLSARVSNFDEFKNQFIENGSLNLMFFEILIKQNKISVHNNDKILNNWINILKIENLNEKLQKLQKESRILELKVLSGYEERIESAIPFLKYYYKKRLEIDNLTMIFSLKLNNLDSSIKDRYLEVN